MVREDMNMLKQKDYELLGHFRKDSRMSLTKMSRATKIPVSTIFDRMRKLKAENIINKHTSIIDFRKLGFEIRTLMLLSTQKDKKSNLQQFLENHVKVNSLVRINNGYNFFIEVIFKNIAEFDVFLEELEEFNPLTKKEFFVMEELRKESFLTHKPNLGVQR